MYSCRQHRKKLELDIVTQNGRFAELLPYHTITVLYLC